MTNILVHHLQHHDSVLRVPRVGAVVWEDEELHVAAYRADPEGYALAALVPGVRESQRARVLLCLLIASWAGIEPGVRETLARVVRVLALGLPAADVLTVLLAVRRRRANHKHVRRTVLAVLFEHPHAAEIVRARRAVAVDCLEHALGTDTARGRRGTSAAIAALYTPNPGTGPIAPPAAAVDLDLAGERPATVTATNRGDLAAALVHVLRGGPSPELTTAVDGYVGAIVAQMPQYRGSIALVVDESPSMRGYGEREWAVASQVAALRLVLQRLCAELVVVPVRGATDLAGGVLDALEAGRPDVVAVASDGYENVYPGDLARVAASLPRAGVTAPVVFCQATYGHSDDLTLRRAADSLPRRTFWHSADLAALVLWVLSQTDAPEAGRWVRQELRRRLSHLETLTGGVLR